MKFIHSLQSEWLKTKRSAASWLCLFGGFFIPLIFLIAMLKNHESINSYYPFENIWKAHFRQLWSNMAIFLLPMGVILSSSLITQMEFKNNTWKQLHTTPQSYTSVFFAKFSVIVLMTLKFFLFFNIGIFITGILPSLICEQRWPVMPVPWLFVLKINFKIFMVCLPVIAIQYLVSLKFKNFLVAIGVGLLGLIGTLMGIQWEYIYVSPYAFCALTVMESAFKYNPQLVASIYFVVLMFVSYLLYISKKEKG
ncbi:MAG: ABC transporter permease [Bacteroidota bacterium]|nr:ABC transporter permease [Bacteroidota bacterium]